jgi:proline iminopeptidase
MSSSSHTYNLYPEIDIERTNWLKVSDLHEMYYEESGNLEGFPVVFLHGGPGSGSNPTQRRFFDPAFYRIILLDQRGCGRSMPLGEIRQNTTNELVEDIEQLRAVLGIEKWLVFAGSWGSTLALTYAIAHSDRVSGLILRGIFLSRQNELEWFLRDVRYFYPEPWDKLTNYIPENERVDLLNAYARRIFSDQKSICVPAATSWNAYESSIMTLLPSTGSSGSGVNDDIQVARARVQLHYILNDCFVGKRDMLKEARALNHIPTLIVQGRYDMVCPPLTAWELAQAMPHAEFYMIPDAGHSAMETNTTAALVAATEKFKTLA